MKLTYNNSDTIITVDGTQEEVIDWYKTFVHSQTACEQNIDTAFVEQINRKTCAEETKKVSNIVNDQRAGEPDEDGWMAWTATGSSDIPNGLRMDTKVEFMACYNDRPISKSVCELSWNDIGNHITKFRVSE